MGAGNHGDSPLCEQGALRPNYMGTVPVIPVGLSRKTHSPLAHQLLHNRPPHLAQHAIRDEVIEILGDIHLFTLKNRIAELCQLPHDILPLRPLRHLMLATHATHNIVSRTELEAVGHGAQRQSDGYPPLGTRLRHQTVELLITIAVESHTRLEALRHAIREDTVPHHLVGTESDQLTIAVQETKPVAVGKTRHTRHIKTVVTHLLHHADKGSHRLGRIPRGNVLLTSMQEVGGIATIKRPVEIGRESISAFAARTAAILTGMTPDDLVQPLTVSRRHILYIRDILQPAFYLQRCSPRLDEFLQMVDAVHIFEGEQIAVMHQRPTLRILQREFHATELRALSAIGATSETILRSIADAGIADTKSTVDKYLKLHIRNLVMNLPDLIQ